MEYAEFAIQHKGRPLDLARRPWVESIYNLPITEQPDGDYRRKELLLFGRQSEKSTTIGNMQLSLANLIPYLRVLYVTASNEQMREFSDERLRAVINDSVVLQRMSGILPGKLGAKETQNVQTKRFLSQAKIVLRSVFKSPDRVRGIASDFLTVDEIQDIAVDFLPVIEEVLFHCELEEGPFSIYAGTPKTFDNLAEFLWARHSTMNEWMVRCERCGQWSIIEEENVGPIGLRCMKKRTGASSGTCEGPLEPVHGKRQWVRTGRAGQEWEGFRLPQPVVIYTARENPKVFRRRWKGLQQKIKRYTRAKRANEIFARSFDLGTKPVTLEQVRRCSLPNKQIITEPSVALQQSQTWAGVDWGTGDVSYTVLSIWHYDRNSRFSMLFGKIYEGPEADPDFSIKDIVYWCRRFNVTRIGADWGFGFHANPQLQSAMGINKVVQYANVDSQKEPIVYDKQGGKFTCHRTRVMGWAFSLIEKGPVSGGCAFPTWDQFEKFSEHILSIYSEYSETRRQLIYNHPRDRPDDFFQTMVTALLASMFEHQRPDLLAPGIK